MDIIEGNVLIAKFLGWRESESKHPYFHPVTRQEIKARMEMKPCFTLSTDHPIVEKMSIDRPGFEFEYLDNGETHLVFDYEDLEFHESWDLLIPAVQDWILDIWGKRGILPLEYVKLRDASVVFEIDTLWEALVNAITSLKIIDNENWYKK